ncbi:hypothetical protein Tco_1263699 [Tanacetum coccineum]
MGLWYSKDTGMSLTTYADADHAGCQDTRCSTSGSAQFLGDKIVSWSSKKQKSTAISSTEAEYIALSRCCLEVGLMRRIQVLDTVYWGFLGVGTMLDIFQNIIFIPYFQYGVLVFWIRRIELLVFGECRHGYDVSSLMDTAYWYSE